MDFIKFVDLLERKTLYFTRLDRMPDHFEGAPTPATLAWIERYYRETGLIDQTGERGPKVLYTETTLINQLMGFVNCWHINRHESDAMWRLYSDRGIAIRSTIRRFRQSLDGAPDDVYLCRVRYTSDPQPFGSTLTAALKKFKSYEHERELRAILISIPSWWTSATPDRAELERTQPPGVPVSVDLDTLVQRVYVSPGRADWYKELIVKVMNTYGLGHKHVETSTLDVRPDLI